MARRGYSKEERSARREEFVDAAMQVFATGGGAEAVSFRNVAAAVGCSYSAPYRYFSGKDELMTALRARAFRWIEKAIRDAIDPAADPRVQLESLAHAYMQAGMERPSVYALMFFQEDSEFAQRSIELKTAKHDALHTCVDVIAAGQAGGILPDTIDALTAAHIFWIGAHGLVSLQVGGQFVMGRRVEALAPVLIHWLESGLQHHDPADLQQARIGHWFEAKAGGGAKT